MDFFVFRGKPLDDINADWVYGYFFEKTDSQNGKQYYIHQNTDSGTLVPIHAFTLSFDTGLKDKNGTKIFTNDIVSVNLFSFRKTEIVAYNEGGIYPFAIPGWEVTPRPDNCEVVGNVFDNPELIPI